MRFRLPWPALLVIALVWSGCQTPISRKAASGPVAPPPVAETKPVANPVHTPAAPPSSPVAPAGAVAPRIQKVETPAPAIDDGSTKIESEPKGALVLVDGVPIGRTPLQVPLEVGANGFLRKAVSIRVRFVATDASETTRTLEASLTPLDKAPACLKFNADGVHRVLR